MAKAKEVLRALEALAERSGRGGCRVVVRFDERQPTGKRWIGSIEAGTEADDSDMVGAASHVIRQPTAKAALEFMLREFGVLTSTEVEAPS
jgi:hypothetical protein